MDSRQSLSDFLHLSLLVADKVVQCVDGQLKNEVAPFIPSTGSTTISKSSSGYLHKTPLSSFLHSQHCKFHPNLQCKRSIYEYYDKITIYDNKEGLKNITHL